MKASVKKVRSRLEAFPRYFGFLNWVEFLAVCIGVCVFDYAGPWWSFTVFTFLIGLVYSRRPRVEFAVAVSTILSLIIALFVLDLRFGFRASSRLARAFGLGYGVFIYALIVVIAGLLAVLSTRAGKMLTKSKKVPVDV